MKKVFLILVFIGLRLGAFAQSEADRKEILAIFSRQEADWNRGDIASFMVGYWESDSLSFTGARGITYGYKPVYENYVKRYPDKKSMGTLTFEVKRLFFLSEGVAQLIGKFRLVRPEAGDAEGFYTLIWKKIDGRWVITSDHTSG
jgi:hypothetical protein